MIVSAFEMQQSNQRIDIFEGQFILKHNEKLIEVEGLIYFSWLPNPEVKFRGKVINESDDVVSIDLFITEHKFELVIDELVFGDISITSISHSNSSNEINLEGRILDTAVFGDKSTPVTKVRFAIPNLREFQGDFVKAVNNEGGITRGSNRIVFENNDFLITIDKSSNFKELHNALKQGGYVNLYSGELTKKQGTIKFSELGDVVYCFTTFLTFLNGRRCAPFFLAGIHEEEVLWTDFSERRVDQYKYVITWPPSHSIEGLDELWKSFCTLWKDDNDKDFITSAIHWYVEANGNSDYAEGAIVMSQIALELIYNWFVIEKKKLLIGKDGENISASNKIRLLLSQVNGNSEVPVAFTNLQSFVGDNEDISDGADAFVQIRNAIVHSQEGKRKKLAKIPVPVIVETYQLSIWYIELSLLYVLKFKGKYFNRCSGARWNGEGEETAPYIKE